MSDTYDMKDLQRAAYQIMLLTKLRSAGIGAIVFAVLAVFAGTHKGAGVYGGVGAAIGALLLLVSTFLFAMPSRTGLLVSAIGMAVVGVWNMASYFAGWNPLWIIVGLLQLKMGYDKLADYRRFSKLQWTEPSANVLNYLQGLVKSAILGRPAGTDRLIEMRVKGSTWRILLMSRMALLVGMRGSAIILRERGELELIRAASKPGGKWVTVSGAVVGNVRATMSEQHFEVYKAWRRFMGIPQAKKKQHR